MNQKYQKYRKSQFYQRILNFQWFRKIRMFLKIQ
jgi:hypothetical protein